MDKELYEVIPLEANLRSRPALEPGVVLTRLKQGQLVTALSPTPPPPKGWLRVRAEVQGTPVEGYVKAFLLRKAKQVEVPTPPSVLPNLPEAHLTPEGPIRRTGTAFRAYPLQEPNQPGRPGPSPADRALQLGKIIDYLNVEQSARYLPKGGQTFCNIYAHDYCHLAGAYLPRVWWRPKALCCASPPAKPYRCVRHHRGGAKRQQPLQLAGRVRPRLRLATYAGFSRVAECS